MNFSQIESRKFRFYFFLLWFLFQFCQYTFILTQYESFSSSTLVFFSCLVVAAAVFRLLVAK